MSEPEIKSKLEDVYAALTMDEFTPNEDVGEIHRAALAAFPEIEKACGEREAWRQIQQEIRESLLWNGLKLVVREDGKWVVRSVGVTPGANDLIEARESLTALREENARLREVLGGVVDACDLPRENYSREEWASLQKAHAALSQDTQESCSECRSVGVHKLSCSHGEGSRAIPMRLDTQEDRDA